MPRATALSGSPTIIALNQCVVVGGTFDPLANVTASNCNGVDITSLVTVTQNNVDTTTPGMYTVTYQVISPTNGKTTTKTIYVGVIAVGPRQQAITDLIQSVALEQTALSHVLNAEVEKMQAVVAVATTGEELLAVNQSVNNMICAITRLEMVLHF